MQPVIGIIIVNWNRKADLLRCLKSVQTTDYPCYQVVVVDNGSTDGSVEAVRESFPAVTLLLQTENLGYTGGNNLAIRYLLDRQVDYFFLLNNDALIDEQTLSILVDTAWQNPSAGFLGPLVLTIEKPDVILTAGGSLVNGWRAEQRGIGEVNCGQYAIPEEVDYISGCALLVPRRVIEQIGVLDEDFFSYDEDMEWCRRGNKHGWQVLLVPRAKAWHPDTRLRDEDAPIVSYYIARNNLMFAQKQKLGLRITLSILFYYVRTMLSWTLLPKWRHKKIQRRALWFALKDFPTIKIGRIHPGQERLLRNPQEGNP